MQRDMHYNHKQRWCWIGQGYNFEPAAATPDGFWSEITEHWQCRMTVPSASLTSSYGATFVPVWEASCQWVRRCAVAVPGDSARSNALAVTWKGHSETLGRSQLSIDLRVYLSVCYWMVPFLSGVISSQKPSYISAPSVVLCAYRMLNVRLNCKGAWKAQWHCHWQEMCNWECKYNIDRHLWNSVTYVETLVTRLNVWTRTCDCRRAVVNGSKLVPSLLRPAFELVSLATYKITSIILYLPTWMSHPLHRYAPRGRLARPPEIGVAERGTRNVPGSLRRRTSYSVSWGGGFDSSPPVSFREPSHVWSLPIRNVLVHLWFVPMQGLCTWCMDTVNKQSWRPS